MFEQNPLLRIAFVFLVGVVLVLSLWNLAPAHEDDACRCECRRAYKQCIRGARGTFDGRTTKCEAIYPAWRIECRDSVRTMYRWDRYQCRDTFRGCRCGCSTH